jgi:hypothetical protein
MPTPVRERSGLAPGLLDEFKVIAEPAHADSAALLEFWHARMADGGFVVGRDVPSRPLARLLRNLTVYEPTADGRDLRVRLAGATIRRRFDRDITGQKLSELFSPEDFTHHSRGTFKAIRTGRPVVLDSKLKRNGVIEMHLEIVVLPVLAPDLVTPWVLVGLFYFG